MLLRALAVWGRSGWFAFSLEPICAIGHGVAALCCATNEDKTWVFQGYSLTGVGQAFCLCLRVAIGAPLVISDAGVPGLILELPTNTSRRFATCGGYVRCGGLLWTGGSSTG